MGAGFLLAPGVASACSVCGLDDVSFLWSALFMMGAPVVIVGAMGGVVLYSARGNAGKTARRGATASSGPTRRNHFE